PDGCVESTTLFEANCWTKASAEMAEAVGSELGVAIAMQLLAAAVAAHGDRRRPQRLHPRRHPLPGRRRALLRARGQPASAAQPHDQAHRRAGLAAPAQVRVADALAAGGVDFIRDWIEKAEHPRPVITHTPPM